MSTFGIDSLNINEYPVSMEVRVGGKALPAYTMNCVFNIEAKPGEAFTVVATNQMTSDAVAILYVDGKQVFDVIVARQSSYEFLGFPEGGSKFKEVKFQDKSEGKTKPEEEKDVIFDPDIGMLRVDFLEWKASSSKITSPAKITAFVPDEDSEKRVGLKKTSIGTTGGGTKDGGSFTNEEGTCGKNLASIRVVYNSIQMTPMHAPPVEPQELEFE